ncbi:hypothetical protein [Paenibacillus sp. DMB5]|uniref:hypothetical protein n=1 Tax=Paenibacillus sp. DMB5 TaxID=1780103 RepID=UPI00076D7183|nr:hypothetical protein [Paenibacillus sp. DMB5]KUP23754.1 hypothetical protein AWJ19_09925 [Paenibacillus sp. DMB5]
MSRTKIVENPHLLPEQMNPELWPVVDEMLLSEEERTVYVNRKNAVVLYFKGIELKRIYEQTGVHPKNLRRLIHRCILISDDGLVWGFRALIPQKKVKPYHLNLSSKKKNPSRKTGEFKLLLETYPSLQDLIKDLFLGNHRRSLEPAMKTHHIHKKFIDSCRDLGIPLHQYPFNTDHLGFKALQRYITKLSFMYFGKNRTRYGQDAITKAKHTGEGEQNHPSTLHPYQKVQFDAHRIDGFFIIEVMTPEGDLVPIVLDRFWILTLIDVATRVVLGYAISLNKEYSAVDVMHCFRNTVIPHEKGTVSIEGLKYNETGGFPSEVYPSSTAWAVWDVIYFDNAKSHLANLVQDRLKHLIGCDINLGPVALPMRRGIIERFFKILEETGFHRLPNTTGSNPSDPRRTDPEKNAIKYKMSFEHLKQLIDILISDYNGKPHGGIYHQTPLELLGKRLNAGLLPRQLEEELRKEVLFMQVTKTATIRGSLKSGKKPYIQFQGVEYRSDKLGQSTHLLNKELILHINVDDLRTIRTFLPDGSEFDYLAAAGKWSITPHSLQIRKAINSLVRQRLIYLTTWDDPIFVYTEFLRINATKGKRGAANKVTQVKESTRKRTTINEPEGQRDALERVEERNAALERAREHTKKEQDNREYTDYKDLMKLYKTKL